MANNGCQDCSEKVGGVISSQMFYLYVMVSIQYAASRFSDTDALIANEK